MSKKSKLTNKEILKKMFEDDESENEDAAKGDVGDGGNSAGGDDAEDRIPDRDAVKCPRCGHRMYAGAKRCDKCGFDGYIPMSDGQIIKTRFILFIILAVIAAAVYLFTRGYFG